MSADGEMTETEQTLRRRKMDTEDTEAIVKAARRLVALWDASRAAQANPTRHGAPLATAPPRSVMTAARRALLTAVHDASGASGGDNR